MRREGGGMRSKVVLSRISAVLFLGALVAFLIGLTMSPRFANAGNCSSLLGRVFGCDLEGGGSFSLVFNSSNTSDLAVRSFGLINALGLPNEISTDCLCVGVVNMLTCEDVQDAQAILMGRVNPLGTPPIKDGTVIVLGQGPTGFSCLP
jgi:hypothetical protein